MKIYRMRSSSPGSLTSARLVPLSVTMVVLLLCSATVSALAQDKTTEEQLADSRKQVEYLQEQAANTGPLLDRAIDANHYVIGPGDRLLISFYGMSPSPMTVEVLPEGVVSIIGVGEVRLGSITLQEAKEKILAAIKSRYKDRTATVTLAGVRSFKVNVTGAVEEPGAVIVNSADRVAEAINRAGGLLAKGSDRAIRLISDTDTLIADLAYYRATGQDEMNPYLHEGYQIFVPAVSNLFAKIESFGAVSIPGVFEFRKGDRLSDLLKLSFGPALNADLAQAELIRFADDDTSTISIKVDLRDVIADEAADANLYLRPDDRLFVRARASFRPKEQVKIVGEVKYPGTYPIQPGCSTLSELIEYAGGLLETASLDEAEMYRSSSFIEDSETSFEQLLQLSNEKLSDFELEYLKELSAQKPGRVAVDFNLLMVGKYSQVDVPLMTGDYIRIPKKSFSVTVLGRVVNPGLVPYREQKGIEYYIQAAGGFGYKAAKGEIRIIKANTGAVVEADNNVKIAMGDKIMVPQGKPIDWWGTIKDVGFFLANIATVYIVIDQVLQ